MMNTLRKTVLTSQWLKIRWVEKVQLEAEKGKAVAEAKMEMAKMMLKDKKPIAEIMKYTGLTKKEIEDLK